MVVLSPAATSGIEIIQGATGAHGLFLDAYAFIAVRSGYVSLRYRRCAHEAHAGEVMLLEPGRTAVLRASDDPRDACLAAFVDPHILESSTNGRATTPLSFSRVITTSLPAHELTAVIADFVRSPEKHRADLIDVVRAVAAENLGVARSRSRLPAELQRTARYLHAHVGDHVSLDELAGVACLSKYHLTRLFHSAYGLPPHAYQLQLRLAFAKRLISSGVSVARAGILCGFAGPVHLHRHFRARFGVAPGFYASQQRDLDLAPDVVTRLSQLPLRD